MSQVRSGSLTAKRLEKADLLVARAGSLKSRQNSGAETQKSSLPSIAALSSRPSGNIMPRSLCMPCFWWQSSRGSPPSALNESRAKISSPFSHSSAVQKYAISKSSTQPRRGGRQGTGHPDGRPRELADVPGLRGAPESPAAQIPARHHRRRVRRRKTADGGRDRGGVAAPRRRDAGPVRVLRVRLLVFDINV